MTEHHPEARSWFRSRSSIVLLAFLAIATFFVVTEHRAHALSALSYLLLLACPLLHLFHGGHRGKRPDHAGHDADHPEDHHR